MAEQQLPTADDFFGKPPLPTADEFFAPEPKTSMEYPRGDIPASSPEMDAYFHQTSVGRVLDAAGQGMRQAWGGEPLGLSQDTIDYLRKSGTFNEYKDNHFNTVKAFNEGVYRPAAIAFDAAIRVPQAIVGGAQAAVAQIGEEAGQPKLGREIAAAPEAFPLFGAELGAFHPPVNLPQARSLGVMGTEGEYFGTAEKRPLTPEEHADAIKAQLAYTEQQRYETGTTETTAAQPVTQAVESPKPDIHQVARQIDPETFQKFDELQNRKDVFRRWITELDETRRQQAVADAPHTQEIADLQAKMEDATPRLQKKYQARLEPLQEARDAFIEEKTTGDSADMAKIRKRLMETDYAMRDLSPKVSEAYLTARSQIEPVTEPAAPTIAPAETPTAVEAAPEVAPEAEKPVPAPIEEPAEAKPTVAPVEGKPEIKSISADVAQKLVAAGRPADEAEAAGKLIGAHYWTRAARFEGAKGNGLDLYLAEAPEIRIGKSRVKAGEMELAQGAKGKIKVVENARNTITLFKSADASTFIHETGHQWLEELQSDAADQRAPADLTKDMQTVREWLKVEEGKPITKAQHERFARGFETYMMEGRAPSSALARVFEQFRQWLTSIYQTVAKLKSPITNDIRDVFDRLIVKKPETVIAPEREPGKGFADLHEADAETTPAPQAHETAGRIQSERDAVAAGKLPEDQDARLKDIADQTGRREARGAEPDRNGNAPGPVGGEGGPVAQPGTVGAGGGEIAPEGVRPPEKPVTDSNAIIPREETKLLDKAGNIRLDNLNTPEDVNQVIREFADKNEDFIGARRGVIGDDQVLDLADALGMTPKSLNLRRLGEAFNAEQIVAARKLLIQSAVSVRDAMIKAAEGTDQDVMAYAEARTRHRMIQEQVSGITAEAGRALRAFREIEGAREAQVIGDFIRDATGKTLFQMREEARLGAQLDTSAKVSKFINDSAKPTFGNMVLEYWINGLISGPATHTTYSVGNAMLSMWKAGPETAAAGLVGKIRELSGSTGPRVLVGEAPAQMYGLMRGVRNGIIAAWESMKGGRTTLLPGELENMTSRQLAMSPLVNPRAAIPGTLGQIVRIPSRGIAVIHSFFRSVNYEREMAGLAYRTAAEENLTGEAFTSRVAELETNPNPEMMQTARTSATEMTLMGKGGELTQALTRLTNIKFAGGQWLKFVDPFVHISSNIIEEAVLKRTAMGVFDPQVRADIMGKNGPIAKDIAIGRMIAGSTLAIGIGSLAAEGLINGSGPSDPKEAAIYTMVNGPPHSILVGDTWYGIHRLGVIGMLVGITADLYQLSHAIGEEDASTVASMLMHAFTQNIMDESFMRGPADLIKALTDADRYGPSYVRNMLSSFIPFSVGMGQAARGIDPYSRQARTILDAAKNKVPWLSETLLPRYDIFGAPIPNKEALGVAGLSAIYETRVNTDPVPKAMLDAGVFPSLPKRQINGVDLTDEQYADYSRIAGRYLKQRLDAIVANPGFGMMPEEIRKNIMETAIKQSRQAAASLIKIQSIHSDNNIIQQSINNKLETLH